MKIRQFCLQAKVHSLLFTGNLTGELSTEFKYFTTSQTSSCVSILVPRTTPAKSCCFMAGKQIAFTIFSPIIFLFTLPSTVKPSSLHYFIAHESTALNNSTSSIFSVSRLTTSSIKDLSSVANPSDFIASSRCLSITFQHRSTNLFLSN